MENATRPTWNAASLWQQVGPYLLATTPITHERIRKFVARYNGKPVRKATARKGGERRPKGPERAALTEKLAEWHGGECALHGPKCTGVGETIDKIIPGEHGPGYAAWNCVPACAACNNDRRDTPLAEYVGLSRAITLSEHAASIPRKARKG